VIFKTADRSFTYDPMTKYTNCFSSCVFHMLHVVVYCKKIQDVHCKNKFFPCNRLMQVSKNPEFYADFRPVGT
jgi:hypothetical protein